ncbi:serine hydrolase [Dermatophilus congolensis]|uniref:serine hydrolase n=1 Tax=Dermatophilus congolensis TaxID=1863 RepID=UPI001AB02429|nr:serine hydrolase [Dermatophilus congolensis]MBO3144615.1 serine hydrolase [Dermatophilus congolensis]
MRALLAPTAGLIALTLAACATGSGPTPQNTPTATPTATATYPNDTIGQAMQWFVGQMSTDKTDSNLAQRLSSEFTKHISPQQLLVFFGELRPQGPWITDNTTTNGNNGTATLMNKYGQRFTLTMHVDDNGKIAGALVDSAPKGSPATTWNDVTKRAQLGIKDVSILAANIDDNDKLTDVHAHDADTPRPVASASKLYILAAIAEKIADEELSWDQELTLTEEDKTLPSGTLQNSAAGTRISVLDAATAMIATSDNTATDLLYRTVGEEAILTAAKNASNDHLEGITPFLTPKQMFWLAYGPSEEAKKARSSWKSSSPQQRRELLKNLPMPGPGPQIPNNATTAQWPNDIEWFVSARDLADVHLHLQKLADSPTGKPLTHILTKNAGIKTPAWASTAFKGGSNTGVLSFSFAATTAKKSRQILIVTGRSTEPVDQNTVIAATTDAANLLATKHDPAKE